jgi:hypothetical protein
VCRLRNYCINDQRHEISCLRLQVLRLQVLRLEVLRPEVLRLEVLRLEVLRLEVLKSSLSCPLYLGGEKAKEPPKPSVRRTNARMLQPRLPRATVLGRIIEYVGIEYIVSCRRFRTKKALE